MPRLGLRNAVAGAFLALAFSPAASAAPYLSTARARLAITVYERAYWGAGIDVSAGSCEREDALKVNCIAESTTPGSEVFVRDWVTLLGDGLLRVHPGSGYESVTTLR
ncbi:MAG: hypothetical protein ABSG95_04345 [Solirubrobacteraceae bacterium]|jgi:hypothetical protein